MKTKNLIIILIFFLLITLGGGLVIFLTEEKSQSALRAQGKIINLGNQPAAEEKQVEAIKSQSASATPETANKAKPIVQPEKTVSIETGDAQNEQIQVVMLINGAEYRTAIKPDSSAYDLMSMLKNQKKIDFKGKDYSGLGFFVEEINGIKNNPDGKNWVYYINGKPASVGISYYKLKNNDIIEWKYENKFF